MARSKRVLVLQHVDVEHPGVFRDFLAADGYSFDAVELDVGEVIPPLGDYAALWVMGGPMDVWEEAEYPWLMTEKRAIYDAVITRGMPYLGFCLGHQLLAAALGGEVGRALLPEVGVMPVSLNPAGVASAYFAGLPPSFDVLQWHGAEVGTPPPGAVVLASSPHCANQAMHIGTRAFSMQFHVEITASTAADWNAIPAYRAALESTLGASGADALVRACVAGMPAFNANARAIYENWKVASGF